MGEKFILGVVRYVFLKVVGVYRIGMFMVVVELRRNLMLCKRLNKVEVR